MKFPYGLADFRSLITSGYTYVDRTAYIRTMEELGRALLFVRPRRFGKSLWLNTLSTWYDLRFADEHERLFGHLEAGQGGPRAPEEPPHRYFVLHWNFSAVGTRGSHRPESVEDLSAQLDAYVTGTLEAFAIDYRRWLPAPVTVEGSPIQALTKLLAVLRQTPHRLCLLIDEYDNFANEIMMTDEAAYRSLLHADGPFKQLMKWVKLAMEGQGLERLFLTGVTPVVLSDLTSGLNICENVSSAPELNALCGFTEEELVGLLESLAGERLGASEKPSFSPREALGMLRDWYNGYRFTPPMEEVGKAERVYNPTLVLYFLKHLQRRGEYPRQMLDSNLAADESKLRFLARDTEGGDLLAEILQTGEPLEVDYLVDRFRFSEIIDRGAKKRAPLASFLYYFGMLTIEGETPWRTILLTVPNLVVQKLYVDEVLGMLLAGEGGLDVGGPARELMSNGRIEPLMDLVEEKLLPRFSARDARWMNELAVKAAFMALLFQDVNYRMLSEASIRKASIHPVQDAEDGEDGEDRRHGYADLVLLLRPDARATGLYDLIFEFKYLKLDALGGEAERLDVLERNQLAEIPAVRSALDAASEQVREYRTGLGERYGDALRLRSYAVVALGFSRLLAREVT